MRNKLFRATLSVVLILTSFVVIVLGDDPCTPLWPRLQFGKIYSDSSSQERIIIKFNTRSSCPKSYATISELRGSIRKIECKPLNITLSNKMNFYQIYQQRCATSKITFDEPFEYLLYGANSSGSAAIPFSQDPIRTVNIIHPNSTNPVKVIVTADWSDLHKKINQYDSINSTLDSVRSTMNINGMVVNGDIAYDLDANDGLNYQDFLNLLSRTARYLPVYFNTGNHEHISDDALKIFYFAFEQYGKDKKLATGLSLGPLYYIGFDPYDSLYIKNEERSVRRHTLEIEESQAYKGLKEWLEKTSQSNKTRVTSSHYPLVCSATDKRCLTLRTLLKDFFDLMLQQQISLYLSGHVHTYQRIYPYCSDGSFLLKQSPYTMEQIQGCMIAIIEGVAGNDVQIVESYDDVKDFTAKVQYGETGIGILEVSTKEVKYQHFVAAQGLSIPNDEILIQKITNQKIIQQINILQDQHKQSNQFLSSPHQIK